MRRIRKDASFFIMATDFPTSLDSLTNPTSTDTMSSVPHSDQHANANDAIEALQTKVGIDSSADTGSIDYKLTNTSSSNPGHKHTLADGATDVTASADEVNVLDGIPETLTATELGYVDGVTSAIQTQLDAKVDENTAITGATKTKITYDAKGLVTGGADATTADIADSADKRYVTDAQLVVIGNTSGTNTGDQTLPVKASGAELDTGTDDDKFATAKAIKDSHNVPSVAPGTSGNLLTSNGTDWTSAAPPVSVSVTTKGDLQTYSTTPDRLPVGADGKVLKANSATATGLEWGDAAGDVATDAIWDAKGDLAVGTGANTASRLAVGTDGYVLESRASEATGLKWVAPIGANSLVSSEVPSGLVNSSNVTFTLASTPTAGTVRLYQNGVRLKVTEDYTISGATITMNTAPVTGDLLLADYQTNSTVSGNADTLDGQHAPTGTIVGTSDTQTLTNKTLTSPKINEDVALTSTATELNLLDGVTQGASYIEAGAKSQIIFCGSYNVWAAVSSTTIVTLKGADGQDVTAFIPIKRPTGKKLYIFIGGRTSITNGKYLEFQVGSVTTATMRWTGTGSNANYNTGWVELGTGAPTDGQIFDFVPYSLVESGGTSAAISRATIMIKYDD